MTGWESDHGPAPLEVRPVDPERRRTGRQPPTTGSSPPCRCAECFASCVRTKAARLVRKVAARFHQLHVMDDWPGGIPIGMRPLQKRCWLRQHRPR